VSPPLSPPAGPGLYIHVPFCVRACTYCDFAREAPPTPSRVERYLAALGLELGRLPSDFSPATIYVGGGTPTSLPPPALDRLLELLRPHASRAVEWTVEANPDTVSAATVRRLRAAGVNRVSLGAQTFDPAARHLLGRVHGPDAVAESMRRLRGEGMDNLSIDLLLAIPASPPDRLDRDLDRALELAPEHLSTYLLSVEPGTPLAGRIARGEISERSDEAAVAEYERARERLTAAGYRHYEISNFARPGRECRHNLLYWTGGEYLGVGPSAHSHWAGSRRGNFQSLDEWAAALSKDWKPAEFEESLPPARRARERLVFWLRLCDGLDRDEFRRAAGMDPFDVVGDELHALVGRGLLEIDGRVLRLAPGALAVSDTVFRELV